MWKPGTPGPGKHPPFTGGTGPGKGLSSLSHGNITVKASTHRLAGNRYPSKCVVVGQHLKPGPNHSSSLYLPAQNFPLPLVKSEDGCGIGVPVSRFSGPLCFRFQCVFRVLPQCLGPESPLPSVLLTVELLSLLVDHEKLAPQLCSPSGKAGQGDGWLGGSCRLEGRVVAGTVQRPPEGFCSLCPGLWVRRGP